MDKLCNKCGTIKPLGEFAKRSNRPIGVSGWCLKCRAAYMIEWRQRKTPEKRGEQYRRENLKKLYGITPADYDRILTSQGGACAICASVSDENLHVDHCHDSGAIRGLLCHGCNTAIGLLEEDPVRMLKAMEYVAKKLAVKVA